MHHVVGSFKPILARLLCMIHCTSKVPNLNFLSCESLRDIKLTVILVANTIVLVNVAQFEIVLTSHASRQDSTKIIL